MMKSKFKFSILLVAATVAAGCGRTSSASSSDSIPNDSLPAGISSIIDAVANNDAKRFSELVSYPIARPYPLQDIRDAKEMQSYYSKLVDDSLKNVITGSSPENWGEYGWRGWTLDDGQYIWVDSLIYDIPYVSREELLERQKIVSSEMNTLWPEMRQGWEPEFCLRADSGQFFRIDSSVGSKTPKEYRLAVYSKGQKPDSRPFRILSGKMDVEGTANNRVFRFFSGKGDEILFLPDQTDDSNLKIIDRNENGKETEIAVKKAYWAELFQN